MKWVSRGVEWIIAAILRVLVFVIPSLIIGIWGSAYLFQLRDTLLAPGAPIEVRYQARGGVHVVRAESFNLNWSDRQLLLFQVSARDQLDRVFAEVDLANLVYDRDVLRVDLGQIDALIERTAEGFFAIEDALPPEADEPSELITVVAVAEANIIYRDLARPAGLPQDERLVVQDLVFQSGPELLAFTAQVTPEGSDVFPLRVTSGPAGFQVAADFTSVEAAPLLPLMLELGLRDLIPDNYLPVSASSLVVTGPLRVTVPADEGLLLEGDFQLSGSGVRVGQTLLDATVAAEVNQSAQGTLLTLSTQEPGRSLIYEGTVTGPDGVWLNGALSASVQSRSRLWPELLTLVPPEIDFAQLSGVGTVAFRGDTYEIIVDLQASRATVYGEELLGPRLDLAVNEQGLRAEVTQASWQQIEVVGQAGIQWDSGEVSGFFESERTRWEAILARFDRQDVQGITQVQGVLSGTLDRPVLNFGARGSGGALLSDGRLADLGVIEFRAELADQLLTIERALSEGANGIAQLSGAVSLTDQTVDVEVRAGGVELGAFTDVASGVAFAVASVTGSWSNPQVDGRLEGYGLEAAEYVLPTLVADFAGNLDEIEFSMIQAAFGAGALQGDGRLSLATRSLDFDLTGDEIGLAALLGSEFAGRASVPRLTITGSFEEPLVEANLLVPTLLARGIPLDNVDVAVEIDRERVFVREGTASIGSGQVRTIGDYRFEEQEGFFSLELSQVPLQPLVGIKPETLQMEGFLNGSGRLILSDGDPSGDIEVRLTDIFANGVALGGGRTQVSLRDQVVTLRGAIGQLDRFIEVEDLVYDLQQEWASGSLSVLNLPLGEMIQAAGPALDEAPPWAQDLLATIQGSFDTQVALSGPIEDPAIEVVTLTLGDLVIDGRTAGAMRIRGRRDSGMWSIDQALWTPEQSVVSITGTYMEGGNVQAQGDIFNFDASWARVFSPDLPEFLARLDASFVVEGPVEDLAGRGSLQVTDFELPGEDEFQLIPVSLLLDDIRYRNEVITLDGQAEYEGLSARLDGTIPLGSLQENGSETFRLRAELEPRTLSDFAAQAPWIDAEVSDGAIDGRLLLSGRPGRLQLTGELSAEGDQLKLEALDEPLGPYRLAVDLRQTRAEARLTATSPGGTASARMAATLPDFLNEPDLTFTEALDSGQLEGSVLAFGWELSQRILDATEISRARINAVVGLTGPLLQPVITGGITLSDVVLAAPTAFPEAEDAEPPIFNPVFDRFQVTAAENSLLVAGPARLLLGGVGVLSGTLSAPMYEMPLTVQGGSFTLPANRIVLEPGGTVNVFYDALGGVNGITRINIDLTGQTTVVAQGLAAQSEVYNVTVNLRGDLAQEQGIQLEAFSDPPDLSQDQILAILGQQDLIASLAETTFGGRGGGQLTQQLIGVAVPTLTRGLTDGIAESLQLDFLTLEYSVLDGPLIAAGRSLGPGLLLSARRQLTETSFGPLRYEVRLSYRLPSLLPELGRFRVSLSTDQDRPWRIGIEYARRF